MDTPSLVGFAGSRTASASRPPGVAGCVGGSGGFCGADAGDATGVPAPPRRRSSWSPRLLDTSRVLGWQRP
jgi:hypothetical protein